MHVEGRGGVPRHGDGSAVSQGEGGQVRRDQIHPGTVTNKTRFPVVFFCNIMTNIRPQQKNAVSISSSQVNSPRRMGLCQISATKISCLGLFKLNISLRKTGEMCFSSDVTSTLPFDLFKNMAGISGLRPQKYLYLASCKILNKIATHTIFLNSFPLCCEQCFGSVFIFYGSGSRG
jgi:hypothetical protein